jgi:REP element-mobilizing transposase RayT
MPKTLAYMVTWTTYGTWLQGDDRRYVKDGQTLLPDRVLALANTRLLTKEPVRFSFNEKRIVEQAIRYTAVQFDQKIYALAVCSNHVHLLVEYIPKPIEIVVQRYKTCAVNALRKIGLHGRIWTTGFDKRYCFDEETLLKKIEYVNKHFLKNILPSI